MPQILDILANRYGQTDRQTDRLSFNILCNYYLLAGTSQMSMGEEGTDGKLLHSCHEQTDRQTDSIYDSNPIQCLNHTNLCVSL